ICVYLRFTIFRLTEKKSECSLCAFTEGKELKSEWQRQQRFRHTQRSRFERKTTFS
ncbi:Fibroblast activation protein alpha, partial [Podarcis lilfordi]